jgi:Tfp pilus assembly protein PilW
MTLMNRFLSDQRGFTLTELLVGLFAGMVLVSGLFTILDVTLHQTTRTFSRVDATQRARAALETIENELHSSCYANSATPIVGGPPGDTSASTANQITFWTQYGGAINPVPTRHTIAFDPTAGTLSDTTYATTGSAPKWQVTGLPVTKQLLPEVAQSGATPVFQYYALRSTGPLAITGNPISAENAVRVAEIRITMVVKPADGGNLRSDVAPNTVTNQVDLRLTPIPNPSPQVEEFHACD